MCFSSQLSAGEFFSSVSGVVVALSFLDACVEFLDGFLEVAYFPLQVSDGFLFWVGLIFGFLVWVFVSDASAKVNQWFCVS